MRTSDHQIHVIPLKIYLGVAAALLFLTAITIWVSFIHLGGFNIVAALLIASVKGTLVALFFMHLKYDNKLFAVIFAISLLFVSVFIILTMFDTLQRGQIYEQRANPIIKNTTIYQTADSTDKGSKISEDKR
jgi:cytochrome c oxidase subunit 4